VLRYWKRETEAAPRVLAEAGSFIAAALDNTGSQAVWAHATGALLTWDLDTDQYELLREGDTTPLLALAPDGEHAVLLSARSRENPNMEPVQSHAGSVFMAPTARNIFTIWHLHEEPACDYGSERRGTAVDLSGPMRLWSAFQSEVKPRNLNPVVGSDAEAPITTAPTTAAAVSHDGRIAVTGTADGRISTCRLDSESEAEFEPVASHGDWIVSVAISDDGRRAVSASRGAGVRVWEFPNDDLKESRVAAGPWGAAALAGNARWVLVASEVSGFWIVDITGVINARHLPHAKPLSIAVTRDGRRAAWTTMAGGITVLDLENAAPPRSFYVNAPGAVAVSSDGSCVVSGGVNGDLWLWEPDSGNDPRQLPGAPGWATATTVSADGGIVATATQEGSVHIWDVHAGTPPRLVPGTGNQDHEPPGAEPEDGALAFAPDRALALTPDGRSLLVASEKQGLRVFDVKTLDVSLIIPVEARVKALDVSTTARYAAVGCADGTLDLFDLMSATAAHFLGDSTILACTLSSTSPLAVSCVEARGCIHVLDAIALPPLRG
jgi:WD40 repeat protein